MTSWLMGTAREPARALVRVVAGVVLAVAASSFFWFDHLASAILTVFWALLLMGPVLAWPLIWGPLLGRCSGGIAMFLVVLPVFLGNGRGASPGETAVLIGISIPFFVFAVLVSFPQQLVGLVQRLIRR